MPGPTLARAVAGGLVEPGGPELTRRLVEGLGIGPGERVVEIAPGFGAVAERLLAASPGSYVGLDPDPVAVARLRERLGGPGRAFRDAPVDATGLEDGSASVVVIGGLLSTLPDERKAAVLAEAARVLRTGGRLGLHEVCLRPADGDGSPALAASEEERLQARIAADGDGALRPLTPDGWRAALAGRLVTIGTATGPLHLPHVRDLLRGVGMRPALALAREMLDPAERAEGEDLRTVLELHARRLAAIVLVAEKPLIYDLRRPRYG